jgi:hypothetical protein
MFRNVWFWKELAPLVVQFCRREGLGFNEVVNLAVQSFLGQCDVEELRLKAKLVALMKEESELRKVCSCMLRSGSYLPFYAEKVLKDHKGKPSPFMYSVENGDRPLRALGSREEKVFRKICTRREEIACKIAEIQNELLKDVKPFKLDFEGSSESSKEGDSRSRAHDNSEPNGGEKEHGEHT